ncbi:3186_t:CDS:1, partial [Racocetra persica]
MLSSVSPSVKNELLLLLRMDFHIPTGSKTAELEVFFIEIRHTKCSET